MPIPNFLIIGAPRSGTTSLTEYLRQHPNVFMSDIKEPHFFAFQGRDIDFCGPRDQETMESYIVSDWQDYKALFRGSEEADAIGEASAMYMYSDEAASRINQCLPDVRMIAILRNPIDRAYSHYLRMRRMCREPLDSFTAALEAEDRRVEENWAWPWHYVRMGFYHRQLGRYFEKFKEDQIKVYLFDEFKEKPKKVVKNICSFLDIKDKFDTSVERYNVSGKPKSKHLNRAVEKKYPLKEVLKRFVPGRIRKKVKRGLRKINLKKTELRDQKRYELYDVYEKEINRLEDSISRDLSHWKES